MLVLVRSYFMSPSQTDTVPEFRTNKPSDIISTLVSIYDSKDLFVKELQVLLAQRLLSISKDNVDKVEREVSFLSPRFDLTLRRNAEKKYRNSQDSFRRSRVASLRSHVERHDRFQANRYAYPRAKIGMSSLPNGKYS